ncbi:glycosyltransferase family 2 protein [Aequorivita lipolytica]|uniref:Glycosyltransferase family 2 protein n=1 Tax=Aequorivita lipolytica TaxID=153267 RepID=A0A5C6YNT1_9FLAO|nr:glycosyltransferase family 2 protein [Aequorivita lipolytica]TXD69000.1 glycosyltransferase family 2 protein [Aequorivita lipolytica]SRX52972.1 putative glycosyltransferase [Aequorivita lipolytica]
MNVELSVVMPCLNEAETLAVCIKKAQGFFEHENITGEVIIADNGSTDGSQQIAKDLNAAVVNVPQKGYGSALRGGIEAANGKFIIMGDADDSYDFNNLMPYLSKLREGNDMVMGNRFKGGIKKGAMPFLHKYLGNPVLSFIGRLFFKSKIGDFHCGLRGFSKEAYFKMELKTTGMEFASEMIVKASLKNLKIAEVPTVLSPDGRSRPPHLNTWRDGWRHLRFLVLYSPNWLFLIPGLLLMVFGLITSTFLVSGPVSIGAVNFGVHTLLYTCGFVLIGFQFILFYGLTKVFTVENELLPKSNKYDRLFKFINLEKGLVVGLLLVIGGIVLSILAYADWQAISFGNIENTSVFRRVIPAVTLMLLGVQVILFSLFFSILGLKK